MVRVEEGYIPDSKLDALLRTHTAVVLPYLNFSAQSGVLNVALAYRVPVVVSDVGALGETVRQFGIGTVVKPGQPAHLAAGVSALCDLPVEELAGALDNGARELSWARTALATTEVYRDVLNS